MWLYLIRHGVAAAREGWRGPDTDRSLSGAGRARFRRVARRFARGDHLPSRLCSSRLVRAVQTAEGLALALRFGGEVEIWPELGEVHGQAGVQARLCALGARERVALVGHEPQLSTLLSWLLGEPFSQKFPKGGIACVRVRGLLRPGGASFRWLLAPQRGFLDLQGERLLRGEGVS